MKGRLFAVVSLMLIAALFRIFEPRGSLVSAQAPTSVGTPTPSAADEAESGALDGDPNRMPDQQGEALESGPEEIALDPDVSPSISGQRDSLTGNVVWDFGQNSGGAHGWDVHGWECQGFYGWSFWVLDPQLNGDPWIVKDGLYLDNTLYWAVQLRILSGADNGGNIFWKTSNSNYYSADKSKLLSITPDSQWRTITIPVNDHSKWMHYITGLRIDPAGNGQASTCGTDADNIYIDWVKLLYDNASPSNPTSVNPGCTASSNVWQKTCSNANFTWSGASDAHSGVKGYYYYWGTSSSGNPTNWTTSPGYNPGSIPSGSTYYLRVKTEDNAGRISNPTTLFTLKYDGTAPSNPASINPGCTASSNVWQNTCSNANFTWSGASDNASGVAGYYYYWGTSSSGTCSTWRSSAGYNPGAIWSGSTYYLRIATRDNAGNTSSCQTKFILKYDGTAPSNPTSINPGCTATSNVWQNTCNNPNFTWSGASDNASGVAGYYIYWGTSSSGSCSTWTTFAGYNPGSIPSGSTYYLRIATKDNAGNISSCQTIFVLRYDGSAPSNPTSINPGCTATSNVWQNTCNNPNFTWSGASDNASGVAGYYIYWGTSSGGSCSTSRSSASYDPPAVTSDGTYYLRIRTRDNAGNFSSCETKFILKYDGTAPSSTASPPTYDNGGSISVGWIASDNASGVASTKLYVRKSTGCWADSGLPAQTGTSGTFSYTPSSDGTYYFQSVSTDNAGNQELVPSGCTGTGDDQTVYDTTDPSSTASSPAYDNEDPIPVSWSASDLTSGVVAAILYARHSTGSWQLASSQAGTSGSFHYTPDQGDGTYYFQTVSFDRAGNHETVPTGTTGTGDSQTIYDTIPPQSNLICPPYYNQGPVMLSWTASDATSGVASTVLYVRESTGSWANTGLPLGTSGTLNYNLPSDGIYYFQMVSTDRAGNQETPPVGTTGTGDCETIYDTIAPESSATSPPFVSEGTIPVSWTASDATSGVTSTLLYARILTGSWELANLEPLTGTSGTFNYNPDANGTYYFQTVSTDQAGNQEAVPTGETGTGDTQTVYDTDTPSSSATCPTYDNLGTIPVGWTAVDTTSGVASTALYARKSTESWLLDSSQTGTEGTFPYTPSDGDGSYYFQTVSTNQAGNQEEIPEGDTGTGDCQTIYDTTPPTSTAASPAYDNGGLIVVAWSASDATSGVEETALYERKSTESWGPASLEAQTGTSGSFEWEPDRGDGTYCFQTVARDFAGNREPIPSGSTGDGDSCTAYEAAGIVVSPTSGLETSEAGGTAVFTVTLTSQPTSTVTIGLNSSDLTEGTVSPSELTFDAKGSQVVTITGIEDFVDDEDIGYTIILSPSVSTDPNYNALDGDDVSVTNRDDDTAGITISPTTGLTTSEAGDAASFGVTLESQPTSDVAIVLASDNLQEGTLSSNPLTLTFSALNWNQTQSVTVTGADEAVDDGDIAYAIISAPASSQDTTYNGLDALNVSLTNIDNDGPALSILDQAVSEGDSGNVTALFTVTLSAPSPQDITVEYATTDDTATAGDDYTSKSGSLSISAGDAHGVIPVEVTGDSLDEENERFLLTLSNPTNATLGDSQASGTILDDDEPPTVDFSAASYTVQEDAGSVTISVSLSAVSAKTVSVDYATSDGTATTADGDYTATSGTLTFNPSELTHTFNVPISNDGKDETNETVIISLSDATNATIGQNDPATLTIVDDDLPPTVEFSQASYSVQEDAALATITVSLSAVSGKTMSVDYATSDGTADDADYTPISGTLTFDANTQSISQTFTVPISDDQQDEENQTLQLTLSNLANGTLGNNHPATLTILDNDTADIVISPTVGLTTTETGGSATFSVVLATQPTATVTINLASSDSTEGALSQSALTFTPDNWYIAQSGRVNGVNDDLDDGDVSYTIQTTASSGDPTYDSLDPADLSVANLDEDQAGITLNPTSGLVTSENGQQASFTVVLDSQPSADVALSFSSSDSSEGQLSAQALLFAPATWHIPQTITVTGVNDDLADGPIAYTIVSAPASSTDSTYNGLNPADPAVTNSDNDQPDIIVNPTSGLQTSEQGGQASFSVILSSQPTADVTIFLTTTNSSEGTVQPTSLTFTPQNWSNSRQVTVIGEDDSVDDGDISYTILLNPAVSADSGYNGRDPDDVSVTNLDNDSAGITVLPVSGLRTTESGQTASFSVRLESQPTHEVQLPLNSDNLSEGRLSQNPMSLSFSPLNWNQPQVITVTGVDDSVDDGDIAYTIVTQAATSNDPNYSARNAADVALVNLDDDGPTISFSTQDVTVGEGNSGQVPVTFVVMLSASSPQEITVDYTTADGTAQAGSDYSSQSGTILIPAGRLSDTISVFVLGDTQDETNESFTLNLSNPVNGTLGDAQAEGHITDDDSPAISLSDVVVTEANGPATFTVNLSAASPQAITVAYATSDGTASAPNDYSATSGTLTIPAGSRSGTINVPIIDDAEDEENESFTLNLSNATNATLSDDEATGTISDDDAQPTVDFSAASYTVQEDAGSLTIEVSLSAPSEKSISVDYASSHGSATSSDYTPVGGTLSFAAGETSDTFPISIHDDAEDEGNESFTLTLSNATHAAIGANNPASVTIIDNDDTTVNQVAISGHQKGMVGHAYPFTATVSPAGATLPITYRWQADDHQPITHTAGMSDNGSFSWSTAGIKTISVSASNGADQVLASHQMTLVTRGDVNCSAVYDGIDVLFAVQYVQGQRDATDDCPLPPSPARALFLPACDVNDNATCDGIDALLILRCVNGYNNALCPAAARAPFATNPPILSPGQSATLHIGAAKEGRDGRFTIPISAKLASQLGATTIDVHYDPALLLPTRCAADPNQQFELAQCNHQLEPGTIRLTGISATGASGDLLLAEIAFQPVKNKPLAPLRDLLAMTSVTFADPAGNPIDVQIDNHTRHTIYLPTIQHR